MAKKQNIKTIIKKKIDISGSGRKIIIGKSNDNNVVAKKKKKESTKVIDKKIDQVVRVQKKITTQQDEQKVINKKNDQVFRLRSTNTYTSISSRLEKRAIKVPTYNYIKKSVVDYDLVICIPSHNRFDKANRLINQFNSQKTKYTFKIILLNDGSNDKRYDIYESDYPNLVYLKNNIPNGKVKHWYCYNQLWEYLKKIETHCVLQTDDDFILCDGFIDKIVDLYFENKNRDGSVVAIAPHLWSFDKVSEYEYWWKTNHVDGIVLLDYNVIKFMGYGMQPVDANIVKKTGETVRTWNQIKSGITNIGGKVYRTDVSLVYHDGNNDSKLHSDHRKNGKSGVYTQKFIGKII